MSNFQDGPTNGAHSTTISQYRSCSHFPRLRGQWIRISGDRLRACFGSSRTASASVAMAVAMVSGAMCAIAGDAGGTLLVRVQGLRAGAYRVEASENLRPATWQLLTNAVVETGQPGEFRQPLDPTRPRRFYRVVQ